jgi:hypothetical protein
MISIGLVLLYGVLLFGLLAVLSEADHGND